MVSKSSLEIFIVVFVGVFVLVGLVAPLLPDLGNNLQSILGISISCVGGVCTTQTASVVSQITESTTKETTPSITRYTSGKPTAEPLWTTTITYGSLTRRCGPLGCEAITDTRTFTPTSETSKTTREYEHITTTTNVFTNPEPIGHFDSADCNYFIGWGCDPSDYSQPIVAHFYKDGPAGTGTFIGSIVGNVAREQAVGEQCGGYTNHGVKFPTPDSVKDGVNHSIYGYAINIPEGTNPGTVGNPKYVKCAPPATYFFGSNFNCTPADTNYNCGFDYSTNFKGTVKIVFVITNSSNAVVPGGMVSPPDINAIQNPAGKTSQLIYCTDKAPYNVTWLAYNASDLISGSLLNASALSEPKYVTIVCR